MEHDTGDSELLKISNLKMPNRMPDLTLLKPPGLKLRTLAIQNYKRLDSLEVNFPRPKMRHDPDVLVLGSQNGGGKTSVIECIGLLYFAITAGNNDLFRRFPDTGRFIDLTDLLIKAGRKESSIIGSFEFNGNVHTISLNISRSGKTSVSGAEQLRQHLKEIKVASRSLRGEVFEDAILSLLSFNGEPLISPPLIHFNSYRKVQEGNPNLAAMVDEPIIRHRMAYSRSVSSLSAFKVEMLRSLLSGADLFEGFNKHTSDVTTDFLNDLLRRYTGGTIDKLRPLPDNSLDFRITSGNGTSFAFDGLSSGQKEIVATLFLIWRHSRNTPCIVLIDEPELHLNAEWHADFVERLYEYGPHNQYILATHSEQIFDSVNESRRAILIPSDRNETRP